MRYYDIDGLYRLLAATVRRAIADVHCGNPARASDAVCWLDDYYPQWRRYEGVKYGKTQPFDGPAYRRRASWERSSGRRRPGILTQ